MESLNDVGSITYFNADGSIHETVTFNNQERYLEEAKEALKTRGITGWKCNTLSKDLNLHYELYKMIADEVDDDRTTQQEIVKTYAENPISVAKKMKEWENDFFHPAQGGDSKRHNMIISSAISFDREQEYREKCQAAITRSLIYNLCRSINQDNERGKKVLAHTSKTTKKIQPKRITARKAARMEPIRPE